MMKIAFAFPWKGFFSEAFKTFEEHNSFQQYFINQNEVVHFQLEEVVIPDNKFENDAFLGFDVIISRGITAELIKTRIKEIPVVEISVVGNDLIRTLFEAKDLFGNKTMAIIGSHNMIYGVEALSRIIGVELKAYHLSPKKDSIAAINEAVNDRCEVIVGGVKSCEYAKEVGLENIVIKSGHEALWQVFSEAKRMAIVRFNEQSKAEAFKTILDYTPEGILEIDEEKRILICNINAQKILNVSDDICGKFLHEVISNDEPILAVLEENKSCFNELVKYNGSQLAVTRAPVYLKDKAIGMVITMQGVSSIQNVERSIRKKIYSRGHIARYCFEDIVGDGPVMQAVINKIKRYADADFDVLILGKSGTGKELFAQSLHNYSMRRNNPFVAVNCAAIQQNLLESELFGYVEGAFTGAVKGGKEGLFEQAHGGTIFLDEIAEISQEVQCKLLRVLQEREIMRLGDNRVLPVNIRVIAATNKDIFSLVQQGKFREDLYYRLDVLTVRIPCLNERREDIPLIAKHIINQHIKGNGYVNKKLSFSNEALELLKKMDWIGNVRQLTNVCTRAAVLCKGTEITGSDLEDIKSDSGEGFSNNYTDNNKNNNLCEYDNIMKALKETNYNHTKAAEILGISRTTLWKKLNKK